MTAADDEWPSPFDLPQPAEEEHQEPAEEEHQAVDPYADVPFVPAEDEVVPIRPGADTVAQLLSDYRLDLGALLDPNRPPREWVIHGLIPAGASVSIVAPAGVGKSLLVLSAMLGVARGDRAWADLSIPRPRRVLYVDMENTADDLAERLPALGVRRGDDLAGLVYLHLPTILPPLDTLRGGAVLAAVVNAAALDPGDVVVLDSWQRVVRGPENDSDTMRAFYACTGAGLKRRRLTVIRTDNAGKDAERGARGTSGKRDDVDLELLLARGKGRPGRMTLTPSKTRLPDVHPLTVEMSTADDDGRVVYSAGNDPRRAQVIAALQLLDEKGVDPGLAVRRVWEGVGAAATAAGVPRWAVREAQKERASCA